MTKEEQNKIVTRSLSLVTRHFLLTTDYLQQATCGPQVPLSAYCLLPTAYLLASTRIIMVLSVSTSKCSIWESACTTLRSLAS